MKKQGGYLVEGEENVDKLREGLFPAAMHSAVWSLYVRRPGFR